MNILNLGSMNVDHVYAVDHFVRAGETLAGTRYQTFAGGKGFNQSTALARAGARVIHLGRIGRDAEWLLRRLQAEGVETAPVAVVEGATGHAVIQVVPSGENAIVLYGGANRALAESDVDAALGTCSPGDYFLLQNETNLVAEAIAKAHARELRVILNPAPMAANLLDAPLELVDIFILNETEAEGLTGQSQLDEILATMRRRFPRAATVLTLGSRGALYADAATSHHEAALHVTAVDTTAAGDTFIGYFLAELMRGGDPSAALKMGCRAAAICVTRAGASDSIPYRNEVEGML
jgi:ribokinase